MVKKKVTKKAAKKKVEYRSTDMRKPDWLGSVLLAGESKWQSERKGTPQNKSQSKKTFAAEDRAEKRKKNKPAQTKERAVFKRAMDKAAYNKRQAAQAARRKKK